MKQIIWISIFMVLLGLSCSVLMKTSRPEIASELSIVPKPQSVLVKTGSFEISQQTPVIIPENSPEAQTVVLDFINHFKTASGIALKPTASIPPESKSRPIVFALNPGIADLKTEGYQLVVSAKKVLLSAAAPAGLFYGVQTLFQLFPPEIYSRQSTSDVNWTLPAVEITDTPRYGWRGMMLDVSRHFFPKEFIYNFIDYLAMHKLNTFHWHLCDDQGWRIEIKKYPKLTDVGAWRVDRLDKPWNAREPQKEGEEPTYGGFYTQDEIRDIVKYAQSRFITIVPEIEMPGHTVAALAAYPQYSCEGGPFHVLTGGYWPISDIYCAGNDSTFIFLQNILSEVIDLFPGKYIHIGGDEAEKSKWKKCPKCQARIEAEGLADEHELQSYFIKRIEKFLNRQGRQLIGWDEILEGGLAPEATVMSWRGFEGGIAAAKAGHDVVMSPTSHCYFDYYQGDPDQEPLAIGGYLPLKKVYSFEPTPSELSVQEAQHILGGQANVWTEYMLTPDHIQYMIFPRIAALSEVVWSAKDIRNWDDFKFRLDLQMQRYEKMGVNYAKSAYNIQANSGVDLKTNAFTVELETEISGPKIFYTLNGSEPSLKSELYTEPIVLTQTSELKARSFKNGRPLGKLYQETLKIHRATGKKVTLKAPYAERYQGGGKLGLTNSLFGSTNHADGRWQGFEQVDLEAIIDLEQLTPIKNISSRFLSNINSWIFLPPWVEFAVSEDGVHYQVVAKVENDLPEDYAEKAIKIYHAGIDETRARYVRVFAKNVGICPEWHQGAGGKAWLFVDEIVVE